MLPLILSQADVMLVKNAQNLMKAVIKTVQAAEAACMKVPPPHTHVSHASYPPPPHTHHMPHKLHTLIHV